MRRSPLIGAWCVALVPTLAGCAGGEEKPEPSLRPVRLEVTAPADAAIVRGGTLDVRGRVSPAGAHVRVLGRPADVEGEIEPLGLRVEVRRGGGLLDRLLPGDLVVCDQEPAAGTQVRRGR